MGREDLNVEPRIVHGTDAAWAQFGKTRALEILNVILVDGVQRHQLRRRKSLFRADKWQVLVTQRDVRFILRGGAGDNGGRGQSGTNTKCGRTT